MKTILPSSIDVNKIQVAINNGDPFNIPDTDGAAEYIAEALSNTKNGYVEVFEPGEEDFEILTALLDYQSEAFPNAVYVVATDSHVLAFAMEDGVGIPEE